MENQDRFQLTHSRGVRLSIPNFDKEIFNFNSRTHVECDYNQRRTVQLNYISTHALTWSATVIGHIRQANPFISTHALTWSATDSFMPLRTPVSISTHALTWSATFQSDSAFDRIDISTHALTWSATGITRLDIYQMDFNSRTHVECDGADEFVR